MDQDDHSIGLIANLLHSPADRFWCPAASGTTVSSSATNSAPCRSAGWLERCSRLRRSRSANAEELATRLVLRSLARRVEAATLEAGELEAEILGHVRALAPQLLDEPGIGPIVSAQLIVAWSHHGRVRSEAAFARHAGVAPLEASSGKHRRHRLDRIGDRKLNSTVRCT